MFPDVHIIFAMSQGGIERSPETYRLTGTYTGNASLNDAIEWLGDVQAMPTEQQVIDWHTAYLAQQATENTWQTARESIRNMAETALEFAQEIAICFEAISNAQFPPTANDAATFTAMITALNNVNIGNGFRNVVRDSFQAQSGITLNFADVSGVTASQQQRFNAFCDYFFTKWAFMVFIGRGL
jgi:hypothetical protein